MAVACPNCGFELSLKGARTGTYRPTCPKCRRVFSLTVHEDGSMEAQTGAAGPAATIAPPPTRAAARAVAKSMEPAATSPAAPTPAAMETAPPPPAPGAAPVAAPATPQAAATLPPGASDDPLVGKKIGGYEIEQKLGAGGMGNVYLARQVSLDRRVALKTLRSDLTADADLVARFAREAFAAAQLTHHHMVQIYDIGQDDGVHFFSMELVEGRTLKDIVRQLGKLEVDIAVGYALQAARGLKAAHDRGMVHRDVKPANLLVADEGLLKVADLGLVKRGAEALAAEGAVAMTGAAVSGETHANAVMGTPAYMAPEQARDAAKVDERADIYSLGCTLYDMIVGAPPFTGKTVAEVITKHQMEPVRSPELAVRGVPRKISDIVMRMMAKNPAERFKNMGEVIRALEDFLASKSSTSNQAVEQQVQELQRAVEKFNAVPLARLRVPIASAAVFIAIAIAGVFYVSAMPGAGTGALLAPFFAMAGREIAAGMRGESEMFRRLKGFLLIGGWRALGRGFKFIVAAVIVLTALYLLGWTVPVLFMGLLGLGAGAAWSYGLDFQVASSRQAALDAVREVVRRLRERGVEEKLIRQTIARAGGRDWEELYEMLFGYEGKIEQRKALSGSEGGTRGRRKHGAWRDAMAKGMRQTVIEAREARQRKHLADVEAKRLVSSGLNVDRAKVEARELAEAMMFRAHSDDPMAVSKIMGAPPSPGSSPAQNSGSGAGAGGGGGGGAGSGGAAAGGNTANFAGATFSGSTFNVGVNTGGPAAGSPRGGGGGVQADPTGFNVAPGGAGGSGGGFGGGGGSGSASGSGGGGGGGGFVAAGPSGGPPGGPPGAVAMPATGLPFKPTRKLPEPDPISDEEKAKIKRNKSYLYRRYGGFSGLLVGPATRLVLSLLLLGGFVMWLNQNEILKYKDLGRVVGQVGVRVADSVLVPKDQQKKELDLPQDSGKREPLKIKNVPPSITQPWQHFGAGIAGAILLVSAFSASILLGWVIVPAALLVFFAHLIPMKPIGPMSGLQAVWAIGIAIAILGWFFARRLPED